ncbi:Heterokaryon incompatibility protein (HET) domain containing protein [Naviculisporaceae sp. PSN 640]
MRLLNVDTQRLETTHKRPEQLSYTILSHTWGEGEVTFQDLTSTTKNYKAMAGYGKLLGCCEKSSYEGFQYTWIDTCCIDKSSSAELSEAINSMFNWYSKAQVCYAYLSDVDGLGRDDPRQPSSSFRRSRWFQPGWTLQELLAPQEVVFFNKDWLEIGTRGSLGAVITEITGIPQKALEKPLCGSETCPHICTGHSVAQKMSWAALRQTTREEDRSYCLMGLFRVNMPLLYGEGGDKAFSRLLQEIMKQSNDDSIFAWGVFGYQGAWYNPFLSEDIQPGFVASWPELFGSGAYVYTAGSAASLPAISGKEWTPATLSHRSTTYEVTQHSILLTAPILTVENLRGTLDVRLFSFHQGGKEFERASCVHEELVTTSVEAMLGVSGVIAVLSCCFQTGRVGIVLQREENGTYSRVRKRSLVAVQFSELPKRQTIDIRHRAGLEVECNSITVPKTMSTFAELEVVLVEAHGYSTLDKFSHCSLTSWGNWARTRKGNRVTFYAAPEERRVRAAILYGSESGGDNFVLAFKWEQDIGLTFTGYRCRERAGGR